MVVYSVDTGSLKILACLRRVDLKGLLGLPRLVRRLLAQLPSWTQHVDLFADEKSFEVAAVFRLVVVQCFHDGVVVVSHVDGAWSLPSMSSIGNDHLTTC